MGPTNGHGPLATMAAAVATAAMVTGCGSSVVAAGQPAPKRSASAPGVTTSTVVETPSRAQPVPTAPVTSAPSSPAQTAAACRDGQVRVTGASGQGGLGTFYGGAEFALVGTTPCSLTGYGGLDVYSSVGVQHAARTIQLPGNGSGNPGAPQPFPTRAVTLTPTNQATVPFAWSETPHGGATGCPSISKLVITAPGLHEGFTELSAALGFRTSLCGPSSVGFAAPPRGP